VRFKRVYCWHSARRARRTAGRRRCYCARAAPLCEAAAFPAFFTAGGAAEVSPVIAVASSLPASLARERRRRERQGCQGPCCRRGWEARHGVGFPPAWGRLWGVLSAPLVLPRAEAARAEERPS